MGGPESQLRQRGECLPRSAAGGKWVRLHPGRENLEDQLVTKNIVTPLRLWIPVLVTGRHGGEAASLGIRSPWAVPSLVSFLI